MLKGLYRDKLILAIRDMCLVDKADAVCFLFAHDLHLQQEVKGLSRQFIEEAISTRSQIPNVPPNQTQAALSSSQSIATSNPKESPTSLNVPASLWAGKPDEKHLE
jgi:hypothetical protein